MARWRNGEVDDASYAALYFLDWQFATHGKRFASRRYKRDPKPDPALWFVETSSLNKSSVREYLRNVFERYQFFGIIDNVPVALAAWLRMDWPLMLCEYIPSSCEVLSMQTQGKRPVTVLSAWPRMLNPVLNKPNAFAFMVHDLEHAWKFFHDPVMHSEQREFFCILEAAQKKGQFDAYLHDEEFSAKFAYLASDMNTHTLHASQFLRAILVEFHLRRENMRHPSHLSLAAKNEIHAVMASLLGTDWLALVEKRMIHRNNKMLQGAG